MVSAVMCCDLGIFRQLKVIKNLERQTGGSEVDIRCPTAHEPIPKLNRWSKDTRTPQEHDCRNLLTVSSSTIAQV